MFTSLKLPALMSSNQNLQPENEDSADNLEDVSVPTLSSDLKFKAKVSKLIYSNRSLSPSRRAPKLKAQAPNSTVQENLSY